MSHQQFYYTSCPQGLRVDGPCDFGIRAASPGARSAGPAFAKHALYEVRAKVPGRPAGDPPVRLAWLDAQTERVLAHSVFVPKDPMGRVGGNFFTHAILGLKADQVSLADIIGTWGSMGWVRQHDGGLDLEPLNALPTGGELTPAGLWEFLADPDNRALVVMVLSAWLGRLADPTGVGKMYVVRPPQDVAWCVYVIAAALPPALSRGLTFSTYEMSTLKSPAWLVGTWGDGGPPADLLPDSCRRGTNRAWDARAGRPPAGDPFASEVVAALAGGQADEVAGFVIDCVAWLADTVELVRLVWAYRHGARSADRIGRLLGHAGTARGLFGEAAALDDVIARVLDGGEFTAQVAPALTVAVENGWVAQGPVDVAYNTAAVLAAKAGDIHRLRRAAEGVVGEQTFPAELVDLPLGADNAEVWSYLLPLMLDMALSDEQRDRWLAVGRGRLGELFSLTDADAAAGLALHMADGEPLSAETAATLATADRSDLRRRTVQALLKRRPGLRDTLAVQLKNVLRADDRDWLYDALGQPVPGWLLGWIVQVEAETQGSLAARVIRDCRDARALDDQLYVLFKRFADGGARKPAHKAADLAADLRSMHPRLSVWERDRLGETAVADLSDTAARITFARFPAAAGHWTPGTIQNADEARRRLELVVAEVSDEAALDDVFTRYAERFKVTAGLFDLAFRRPLFGARLLMGWFSKKREVGRAGVDRVPYDSFPAVAADFVRKGNWELLDLLLARWLSATPGDQAKSRWGLPDVARMALPLTDLRPPAGAIDRLRKKALGAWARAGGRPDPDVIGFLNLAATPPAPAGGDGRWSDLTGLALGQASDNAAAGRGLDALRSLWSEDWADDWAVLGGLLFDRLLDDPARWDDPAAAGGWVRRLDDLRQRLLRWSGDPSTDRRATDWVTKQIADELARPATWLWQVWVAVRAAALVRYHLERDSTTQVDEARKVFAPVRRRDDAAAVLCAFFRGTAGWPDKLAELCYRAAAAPPPNPADPQRPGLLRRVFGQ